MVRRLLTVILSLFVCSACSAGLRDVIGISEQEGLRIFTDVMLTHNVNENYSHRAPVTAVSVTPSYGFSPYFFLGCRAEALIMPSNYVACVVAPDLRWSFGRKHMLFIDKVPLGICFPSSDIELKLYSENSFGVRLPVSERNSAYLSAGCVFYPCYMDGGKFRDVYGYSSLLNSWFAPHLKAGFSF